MMKSSDIYTNYVQPNPTGSRRWNSKVFKTRKLAELNPPFNE